jgi:transcription termination factor NusB
MTASSKKSAPKNRAAALSAARKTAFDVLLAVERGQSHSDDLLRGKAVDALTPADRHLATALVLGVLRWQIRLDHQIQALLKRPNAKLDPEILIALRLGAFQLFHLDRIPARAAIDESVELAKQAGHRFASGMVNAVLRKLAKAQQAGDESPLMAEESAVLKGHDFSRAAGAPNSDTALQVEEKPGFVTGHDFSRAVNAAKSMRALAPEGCFSGNSLPIPPFSAASLAPELRFSGSGYSILATLMFLRPGWETTADCFLGGLIAGSYRRG